MGMIIMKEIGEIIDTTGNHATIRIQRSSYCSKCGACKMGAHEDEMQITVPNRLNGEIGDFVELDLESSKILKASAIVYLIPLACLFLGIALGYWLGPKLSIGSDIAGAVAGIVLTILAFVVIRTLDPVFR